MENCEPKILTAGYTSMEKAMDEAKKNREGKIKKEPEVQVERKEENDFHSALRRELKEKQQGGVDVHFSQIDIDMLSPKALDLYEEYKKKKINFEGSLAEFRKNIAEGSDDYNFAAMLLNWHICYVSDKRHREREEGKKKIVT
jgi:hypothetical protein